MLKKLAVLLCALLMTMTAFAAAESVTVDAAEAFSERLAHYREQGLDEFTIKCNSTLKNLILLAGIEECDFCTTAMAR